MVTGPDTSVTSIGTHRYKVSCAWHGSTGDGYEAYDRSHEAHASPAQATLQLSSDPAFRGAPSKLNPEQLLVMAAASCQLLSFLAVAARARVDVVDYEDDAEGEMPEGDQPMRITRITLRPASRSAATCVRTASAISSRSATASVSSPTA